MTSHAGIDDPSFGHVPASAFPAQPTEAARFGPDGRYLLQNLLGTGATSAVWKAEDADGTLVAVKILADSLVNDRPSTLEFRQKAILGEQLRHPRVVPVLDNGVEFARPYVAMEYFPAGSLADRLAIRTPQDCELVARHLLEALIHVHTAGVVHGDIKPADVLFDADGGAHLGDLGTAPRLSAPLSPGAPPAQYIAPEVLAGQDPDVASDLYSCGRVLALCADGTERPALRRMLDALTAESVHRRPASAAAALAMLDEPDVVEESTQVLTVVHEPAPYQHHVVYEHQPLATRTVEQQEWDSAPGPRRRPIGLVAAMLLLIPAVLALVTGAMLLERLNGR